jgi:hypothetical protein
MKLLLLLSVDQITELCIPIAAAVGIAFALLQWYLVSFVSISASRSSAAKSDGNNGHGGYLLEEGGSDAASETVLKCAEIQEAIALGTLSFLFLPLPLPLLLLRLLLLQGFMGQARRGNLCVDRCNSLPSPPLL